MAEFELPEPHLREVDLIAEPVLGPGGDGGRLRDRLSISAPRIVEVTAGRLSDDEAVRDSLLELQAAGHAEFWLVNFVCVFKSGIHEAEPFKDVELGVELSAAPSVAPPVAWSLSPPLGSVPARRTFSVKLGVNLAFLSGSGLEVAGDAGHEAWYVRSSGKGTSEPSWQFRNVNGRDLTSDNEISMIVEKAAGDPADCHVEVAARIHKRRFGVIRYTAELPSTTRDFQIGKHSHG